MDKKLNIAIGSTCSKPGDLEGNIAQISMLAKKAAANGCDLLLTPELSATGYGGYPEVIACAEPAGEGRIYTALSGIARKNRLVVMAGFVEKSGSKNYLSHYAIYPDGTFKVQRKHRVTPREFPLEPGVELYYDNTEEIGHVTLGNEQFQYFYVKDVKCVIVICADLGMKNLQKVLDDNGVELMLLPVGAGGERKDKVTNEDLKTEEGIRKFYELSNNEYFFPGGSVLDCIHHRRARAAVNMCGFDGKKLYHGGSGSIISQFGDIVGHLAGIENIDRQKPMFVCGEVDLSESLN